MHKISSLILTLVLVLLPFACSKSSDSSGSSTGGQGGNSSGNTGGGGGADVSEDADWVGTWATAPMLVGADHLPPEPGLSGNTLRQVVLTSIGGEGFRVQFSNLYGDADLTLEAVHVAAQVEADSIDPATDVALTFSGEASVAIPAGEEVFSDPVTNPLAPMTSLAVTIHFGEVPTDLTGHPGSRTTSYIAEGNASVEPSLPSATTADRWYVLTGVDVLASPPAASAVILGDSITDGYGTTTNANNRWTDYLSRRLRDNAGTEHVAVLNMGIGGNAVLSGGLGPTARRRFERDVLQQRGVRWVVVAVGVNDIGASSGTAVSESIIRAYEEFIDAGHASGLYVYGTTIVPFAGSQYDSAEHEELRQLINDWIRTSDRFDAVIDLDEAMRDPDNLTALLPAYDNDHLHPSIAGYEAMADAIDVSLFTNTENLAIGAGGAGGAGSTIPPGYPCAGSVPPSPVINDFSTWSDGSWGDSSTLQGGTFYYDADGDSSVQALSLDVADEVGTLTGQVTGGYAGFGFWLASCVDASSYDGISFTVGGNLGNAQLELQVQTSHNYPIDDTNSKGECEGSWSECSNNKATVEVGETATSIQVPWTDLTGGTPIDTLDQTEILGLQWQLNCASDATCSPNLTIDDVAFFSLE